VKRKHAGGEDGRKGNAGIFIEERELSVSKKSGSESEHSKGKEKEGGGKADRR